MVDLELIVEEREVDVVDAHRTFFRTAHTSLEQRIPGGDGVVDVEIALGRAFHGARQRR